MSGTLTGSSNNTHVQQRQSVVEFTLLSTPLRAPPGCLWSTRVLQHVWLCSLVYIMQLLQLATGKSRSLPSSRPCWLRARLPRHQEEGTRSVLGGPTRCTSGWWCDLQGCDPRNTPSWPASCTPLAPRPAEEGEGETELIGPTPWCLHCHG